MMSSGPSSCESEAIFFRSGNQARVFIWEKFIVRLPRSPSQNRDLGKWACSPSHINTSNFHKVNSIEVRSRKPG